MSNNIVRQLIIKLYIKILLILLIFLIVLVQIENINSKMKLVASNILSHVSVQDNELFCEKPNVFGLEKQKVYLKDINEIIDVKVSINQIILLDNIGNVFFLGTYSDNGEIKSMTKPKKILSKVKK